ncbi:MAG: hypothetical protein BroJett038_04420 [Chloroflexota bacterium]|nr:hypothetical protein [Anaerolineae bacterium CFX8]GIL11722.1 MAG: hypothetical protein BroJett038_04420 [Chloroflexota bacterium]
MNTVDSVNEHMRARLLVNRHGKLTTDQWKDMVTEPLTVIGLLLLPGILILGPRLGAFIWGGFALLTLLALAALAVLFIGRGRRYARAPVHFAVLQAGGGFQPFWAFWKPVVLHDISGEAVRFGKRLTPYTRLQPHRDYLVYYLKDRDTNVLLSLAPADHPDADLWQPSETFQNRFARRSR